MEPQPLDVFGPAGKTAIVTGAASGIGRATATLFTLVGGRVLFVDIDEAGVAEAAGAAGTKHAVCDISDEKQVAALFEKFVDVFGRLDVVANVAAYRRKADTMTCLYRSGTSCTQSPRAAPS